MRQTSTTAFLLAFLVALLVLVAAVVFLARNNQVLEEQTADLATEQALSMTVNEQLSTDLAVRDSALDTAEAARDTLANEIAEHIRQVEALSTQVAQQETNVVEAEAAVNQPDIQLFIFSPTDGAVVSPNVNIEFFIAAYADDGVANINVTLNGEPFQSYQAEGQTSTVLRFNWMPEVEETFLITATSTDLTGQMSEATLTLTAAYASEEARQEALQQEVAASIGGIRLLEPDEAPDQGPTTEQTEIQTSSDNLHQQLLFGSDDYTEEIARNDELVLQAFRLIPEDLDLFGYVNAFTSQEILGAYNPETLSVVAYTPILGEQSAYNRWLTAHETMHTLQVDEFGLGQIDILSLITDNRIALRAMTEGEVNFVQHSYLQGADSFSPDELVSVTNTLNQQALSLFNETPPFLRAQFEFAYRSGFQFIQFLFEQGGYELVDNIWTNRPLSSEQILHPEKYLGGDIPQPVSVPSLTDVLEGDWQLIRQDTLGEFYLRQHLSLHLSPEEIDPAATGWGGDQYIVYWDAASSELVMALRLAWDAETDGAEFTTAYTNYLRRLYTSEAELQEDGGQCWQGEDVTCFYQFELETLIVRAPDLETAANVAAAQAQ